MKKLAWIVFLFAVGSVLAQQKLIVKMYVVEHPTTILITPKAWKSGTLKTEPKIKIHPPYTITLQSGREAQFADIQRRPVPSGGSPSGSKHWKPSVDLGLGLTNLNSFPHCSSGISENWKRFVDLGVRFTVRATLQDEKIRFSGTATLRQWKATQRAGEDAAVVQCLVSESYFGGTARWNEPVIIPTTANQKGQTTTFVLLFFKP